jgi:hypothetical protein
MNPGSNPGTRAQRLGIMILALAAAGCWHNGQVASTEILDPPGKGVVQGLVYDSAGRPALGAVITAYPVAFDPVADPQGPAYAKRADTADAAGVYSIAGLDTGSYNLLAIRPGDGARLLIRNVKVGEGTTHVPSGSNRLARPGAIAIALPDSLRDADAYVYIPGTPIHAAVEASGRNAFLDSVPAGRMPTLLYAAPGRKPGDDAVLAAEVRVYPGDTLPVGPFAAWSGSKRIFLNTSATGADVPGTVKDFPLLVRLDAGSLDFAQAQADGRDLRFADRAGKPLPFEIESWDAKAAGAAVWVRLDSVQGGKDGQFIRMYWGNASAAAVSSGPEVFATADGYQGVWHLQESGNTAQGGYRDATGNGNHGQGTDMTAASRTGAVAAGGQSFNGYTSAINAGADKSLHADTGLTLEMWVKPDSFQVDGNFISKGFSIDLYPNYEYGFTLGIDNDFRFSVTADSVNRDLFTAQKVTLGRWYFLTGTFDGAKMRVFIDGVPTDSLGLTGKIADFGRPLYLGHYENNPRYSLHGILDEARMSNVARPPAYIKLSFESQRPSGGRLLRFDPD